MTCRKLSKCFGYAGQKFDLLVGDGLGEAFDLAMLLGCQGLFGELFEAADEGLVEAFEAVAVGSYGGVLDVVEVFADLLRGELAMVEEGDEAGDGAFEVDVVFPQGIVGVDEQGLAGGNRSQWARKGSHEASIGWFRQDAGITFKERRR